MKRLASFFVLVVLTATSFAQQTGTWNVYPAYSIATKCVSAGSYVFALMDTKLMAYDPENNNKTLFDWKTSLNGITVSYIEYSAETKRLIVVYDDGNIDLISTKDLSEVINLPHFKNSSHNNKTINAVSVAGKKAYLCTSFGIVVVNMEKAEIENTYNLDLNTKACSASKERIYVSTAQGMYCGYFSDNLLDKTKWQKLNDDQPNFLYWFDNHLWSRNGAQIKPYLADGVHSDPAFQFQTTFIQPQADCIVMGNATETRVYTTLTEFVSYQGKNTWSHLCRKGSTFWAADGQQGLQSYIVKNNVLTLQDQQIKANSPLRDYALHFRIINNDLYVVGGNWNYSTVSRAGTVMKYTSEGKWVNFDCQTASDSAALHSDLFIDATDIAQDPNDPTHHYVGTARNGIYEFRNGKYAGHFTCTNPNKPNDPWFNSPLKSILPTNANPQHFVVADALSYDCLGNLWVLNCTQSEADTTIRIIKPNGSWTRISCKDIAEATTVDRLFFDSKNRAWMNSRRMASRGICLLDWNKTLSSSDDKSKLRSEIVNQKDVTYNPDNFYCIAEDRDGSIWIGTNLGPFAITDPDNFCSNDFRFEQIIVARNDGSGLADYLLSGIPTSAIAIDGGNRKWFGSLGNGVYLMSNDCQEQLLHFTAENSPLTSDNVYDIAIHPKTGEVFFATDLGICSYISDATEPEPSLDEDAVYAYPNPVDPDYNGLITVRGLTADGEVKICTATGQLVWQGTSTGGTFTWNGCNQQGRRVASGIYHVVANDAEGNTAVVTRIAFIR